MKYSSNLFILANILLCMIKDVTSVRCWVCWAEKEEHGCWGNETLVHNVEQQIYQIECPDPIDKNLQAACMKGQVEHPEVGKMFVGRSCGVVPRRGESVQRQGLSCRRQFGISNRLAETCSCSSDLCNSSPPVINSSVYIVLGAISFLAAYN